MKGNNTIDFIWQALIIFFIFFEGLLLTISVIFHLSPSTLYIIAIIDLFISIFFFIIYMRSLIKFKDKKAVVNSNWPILFTFIPLYFIAFYFGYFNLGLLKFLSIVKIVSIYFFAQRFAKDAISYQKKTRLGYAIAIFMAVLIVCSYFFYTAEHGVNPKVGNFEDSIWFILQTITTVGYGDVTPITPVGRIMGIIAMLSALILTSIITSVATFSLIEKLRKSADIITRKTNEKVENIDEKLIKIEHQLHEMDNCKDIREIKSDLKDLKGEIDDINEYITKKS